MPREVLVSAGTVCQTPRLGEALGHLRMLLDNAGTVSVAEPFWWVAGVACGQWLMTLTGEVPRRLGSNPGKAGL